MKKAKTKKQKPYKVEYEVSFDFVEIDNGTFKESLVHKDWEDSFNLNDMLENRRNAIRHYIDRFN